MYEDMLNVAKVLANCARMLRKASGEFASLVIACLKVSGKNGSTSNLKVPDGMY